VAEQLELEPPDALLGPEDPALWDGRLLDLYEKAVRRA